MPIVPDIGQYDLSFQHGRIELPAAVPHLRNEQRLGLPAGLFSEAFQVAARRGGQHLLSHRGVPVGSFISALEELALQAEVARAPLP